MNKTIILCEGVENFRENRRLIKIGGLKRVPTIAQLLDIHGEHYHGPLSFGHILVKLRSEVQVREDRDGNLHDHHYLDIYTCLKCQPRVECLRSGWEIGWWNGTESKKLT